MPELPEVETTVRGLKKEVLGLRIIDVWTDVKTQDPRKRDTAASPAFFAFFRRAVRGAQIMSVTRRAKNILINLDTGQTVLIHMKMTGHLIYRTDNTVGAYIHTIFKLSDGAELAFSDMRKFGKITLLDTATAHDTKHLSGIGPDPLQKNFTLKILKERLAKKQNGKIKTVLMDQSVIAGIGNIYSDEILWRAGVHPERRAGKISEKEIVRMLSAMKELLKKGINFGGDSTSDYRNIYGLPGKFQLHHNAYQRTGEKCQKESCKGVIIRKVINGRSAHYCSAHQK